MTNGRDRLIKQLKIDGRKMTICIAGAASVNKDDPCIILCTDWLVSNLIGGSEVMLKQRILPKGLYCLPSGEEGYMQDLMRLFRNHLVGVSDEELFEDVILKAARSALFERKKEIAEEFINARYGLSYEEFYNTGSTKMPPDLFREAMSHIKHLELKTDCIIAGYYDQRFPVLVETNAQGEAILKEEFAAVGSGSPLATASLMHRQYTDVWPFGKCLYAIYEAKKYAERVGSVGKRTTISLLYPDGRSCRLASTGYEFLEAQYKKFGPQQIDEKTTIDPKHILPPD